MAERRRWGGKKFRNNIKGCKIVGVDPWTTWCPCRVAQVCTHVYSVARVVVIYLFLGGYEWESLGGA